jgi:hypothetical protein
MSGVDGWTIGVAVAIPGVVFVTTIVWGWRDWHRAAPLRQQMRAQPKTFQTVLSWARFSGSRPWGTGTDKLVRLIIRGDLVQVGAGVPGLACCYFRAPETTICVSRNPPRINGFVSRDQWIVVSSRQDGHVLVSMTDRSFPDEVWNALVTAGAVPTSAGPSRRARLLGP